MRFQACQSNCILKLFGIDTGELPLDRFAVADGIDAVGWHQFRNY